jgi:Kef-type K+ transport system membrane component KefB
MFEEISLEISKNLGFQMSLLLFVALAGYLIASKINQSAIIGEILLGIVIGPSLLGLITYTDFVHGIAQLGAVVLLFVIGLEFKIRDVFNMKYGIIALIGVIVPWICGFLLAGLFGYDFASSVFVGTALTATSVAITANVLKEMGKLQSEAAKAIIGAAVIDDVLGLLFLSFSMQIVKGSVEILPLLLVIIASVVFIVLGVYIGYNFLSRLIERLDASKTAKRFPQTVFIFAIMIAFLYAMIAELIGLAAIVGAFLAGISLEGVTIWHSKDYKEGAEYLQIIFASIFFVSLGVLADFHSLTSQIIWFVLALTFVAIITKIVGCYIGARLVKLSHKVSSMVGVGMIPRGEVAMIVALIGFKTLGVIDQDIYVSLILMSILTTVFVPAILRYQSKHMETD